MTMEELEIFWVLGISIEKNICETSGDECQHGDIDQILILSE